MAAVERWNDEGIDKLASAIADMQLHSGIEHAMQSRQNRDIEKAIGELDEKVEKVADAVTARQITWGQAFTIAASFLVPLAGLVGVVLSKGG